jgi:glutamate dehydrogenase
MTATTRWCRRPAALARRDPRAARLWPLPAAGRHSAEPGLHRRRAEPLPEIARGLIRCSSRVSTRQAEESARSTAKHLKAKIRDALDDVPSARRRHHHPPLSQPDRRRCAPTISCRPQADGVSLAIKLESRSVDGLPEPRPWREIFVYATEVEGVHLRFGPVARGGLRWSDRAQDFRTEVLGLVKAQQVKNAVIVPVGAKGGFVPKQMPAGRRSRDAVLRRRHACLQVNFISSLLVDHRQSRRRGVVPPADVRAPRRRRSLSRRRRRQGHGDLLRHRQRHQPSTAHGFWLDDAFASGGSAGYDHKKMGITARGAWEAVKRHFREMNRDIQTSPSPSSASATCRATCSATACCCRRRPADRRLRPSRHLHRSRSRSGRRLAERKRLFDAAALELAGLRQDAALEGRRRLLARAEDRHAVAEAPPMLGLGKTVASPAEIMPRSSRRRSTCSGSAASAPMCAARPRPTPRSATAPTTPSASPPPSRAKVIGEGANLGVTQRGRIEYALCAAALNTDAIDNSAASIPPTSRSTSRSRWPRHADGALTRRPQQAARRDDRRGRGAGARNNYEQTLALSLVRKRGLADLAHQARFMTALESAACSTARSSSCRRRGARRAAWRAASR